MYFISFQMAFIDSTTQQRSSCPALKNNIGGFTCSFPVSRLALDRYCMHQACVKLHLCMNLRVYFPVHAVHMCWEHKVNIVIALGGGYIHLLLLYIIFILSSFIISFIPLHWCIYYILWCSPSSFKKMSVCVSTYVHRGINFEVLKSQLQMLLQR